MLDVRIACPRCQKRLKTLEKPTPGQRFRCPRCNHAFAVEAGDIKPAAAAANRPAILTSQPYAPPPLPVPPVAPREGAIGAVTAVPPEPPAGVRPLSAADIAPLAPLPETDGGAGTRAFLMIAVVAVLLLAGGVGLAALLAPGEKKEDPGQKADAGTPAADDKPVGDRPAADAPAGNKGTEDAPPPKKKETGKKEPPRTGNKKRPPPPREFEDPPPLRPRSVPLTRLAPAEQARVDRAIDKGVQFLKEAAATRRWGVNRGAHSVGLTALPALTLLECGVPPSDPVVRKALKYVRKSSATERMTYDLALAILLLDRLGEKQDRRLIQTLALRLAAGQRASGGWSYTCPLLNDQETEDLFTALAQLTPKNPRLLFATDRGDSKLDFFVPEKSSLEGSSTSTGRFDTPDVGTDLKKETISTIPQTAEARATIPLDRLPPRKVKIAKLPPRLQQLPVVKPLPSAKELPPGDGTDNSNTQFAILGVWAAGRHGVPNQRTLALLVKRFTRSQNGDGTWGYSFGTNGRMFGSPAMTCSGLLGLAVGHGLVATAGASGRATDKDPAIKKALTTLSNNIGKAMPLGGGRRRVNRFGINFYFLWSLERVGVLFNLARIGGKDWYAWGAGELVDSQRENGSWEGGGYPGATPITNTCFALLFLKRVNLTHDLTRKLDFLADTESGK